MGTDCASNKLQDTGGYSGLDSVLVIRAHNLLHYNSLRAKRLNRISKEV